MQNSLENVHTSFQDRVSNRIVLRIQGSQVPSFKNRKLICRNRLITDPKYKKRMDAIINDLKSQLLSLCRKTEGGTSMEWLQRFLTRSVPQDDCWQVIPIVTLKGEKAPKGEEGCLIEIERL